MLGARKAAGPDIGGIGGNGRVGCRAEFGIALHEARPEIGEEAEDVVKDQNLPVAGRRGADADGGDGQLLGHLLSKGCRDHLQHHREGAGLGEGAGVVVKLLRTGTPALDHEAAQGVDLLGCKANVGADRDAGGDKRGRQSCAIRIWAGEPVPSFDIRVDDQGDGTDFVRRFWWRTTVPLPADPVLHTLVAVYITDLYGVDPIFAVHGHSMRDRTYRGGTTDTSMWFHRPVYADQWNLLESRSPAAARGRGVVTAPLVRADGVDAATMVQEGLAANR